MTEEPKRKQLALKMVAIVFALLLVTVVSATTIHPVYADEDCGEDCGDGCVANVGGISVCTSVRAPSTT